MIYFCDMQQKIVLIGGPGTGKTSVLNALIQKGFFCMHEVSREVTLKAKEDGIDQLFLTAPLLFSEKLLEGREKQYHRATDTTEEIVFIKKILANIQKETNCYIYNLKIIKSFFNMFNVKIRSFFMNCNYVKPYFHIQFIDCYIFINCFN